jgi:hypothetical protein
MPTAAVTDRLHGLAEAITVERLCICIVSLLGGATSCCKHQCSRVRRLR